jgi:hypothetical protein
MNNIVNNIFDNGFTEKKDELESKLVLILSNLHP